MRLDELPRSDKVEDRRGDGPGGFSMGRAGGCPRFNKADLPIYCLLGSAPSSLGANAGQPELDYTHVARNPPCLATFGKN
jgi:hypothetical protein